MGEFEGALTPQYPSYLIYNHLSPWFVKKSHVISYVNITPCFPQPQAILPSFKPLLYTDLGSNINL